MTSNAAQQTDAHPDRPADASPPAAAQLWIRAGGWLVRADQVIAAGPRMQKHPRTNDTTYAVEVAITAPRGVDGAIGPKAYTLAHLASEQEAWECAARVVERMATWKHGYGVLRVTDQGDVHTSRPIRNTATDS